QGTASAQPQAPAAAGGFTQLLQALNQDPKPKDPPLAAASFGPITPAPLAPTPTPTPSAAPAGAGGFTQLLQSLAQPGASAAPQAAPPPLTSATPSPFAAPATPAPAPFAAAPLCLLHRGLRRHRCRRARHRRWHRGRENLRG